MDGDGTLADLADHPAVASYTTPETMPETERLIHELRALMSALRLESDSNGPPLVLVISGYSQLHPLLQSTGAEHELLTLVGEGPAAGLSVLVSGGRELVMGSWEHAFPRWSTCRSEPVRTRATCGPNCAASTRSQEGVVIDPITPSPGVEIQLVNDAAHLSESAPPLHQPRVRIRPLPDRIGLDEVGHRQAPGGPLTIGVEQFTLLPAHIELGAVNLVIGSAGTGKTSVLRLLAALDPGATQLQGGAPWELPQEAGGGTLVVDDADRCTPEQHALLQQAAAAGTRIIASSLPSPTVFSRLPWAHTARAQGANLLLSPVHRSEADAFAVSVPLLARPIPGRAVHLRPQGPRVIQLAHLKNSQTQ
ncbi:hypothetical protein [Nesterenkonia pannonica]|uniref:hypothetical protein n=1 Tax=Nesterenkonia pannonica TaxID=1548602 RepID=UPI0021646013|nr:hypothetical protein [Nesterenkonia pannonica]